MDGGGLVRMREGARSIQETPKGVIRKYINKCGGPPNLRHTDNDSNQNRAYIKKSHVNTETIHDMEKTMSQQCVQTKFVEEIHWPPLRKLYKWFQLVSFTIFFTFHFLLFVVVVLLVLCFDHGD